MVELRRSGAASSSMPIERVLFLLLPFVGAIIYGLWSHHRSDDYYGSLDTFGVETQATILSKRVVRIGGDRPRHAYEMTIGFTVGEMMRRGDVRVTGGFYRSHDPPERVPLRYLPSDPRIRELDPALRGQSARGARTIIAILLFIGVANFFVTGGEGSKQRETRGQGA